MKKVLLLAYGLMIAALAAGTFVEFFYDTASCLRYVYHSFWFIGLWGGLSVGLAYCLAVKQLPLLSAKGGLHVSFLIILAGALFTHCFGCQGVVRLTPQVKANSFKDMDTGQEHALPFTLQLDSFRIDYYPGGEAPRDYKSYLKVDAIPHQVSMNQVLVVNGYRFYQSSYDSHGEGTWLRVNYDPWGMTLTYMGYALLAFSSIALLVSRQSGFRRLLDCVLKKPCTWLVITVFVGPWSSVAAADAAPLKVLNVRQADSLALQPIIYQDRVVPLNTLAADFVKKLTGGDTRYKGLTPEQVLGGWMLAPHEWETEPMIRIKSAALRRHLKVTGEYVCFKQLFESDGSYKLKPLWNMLQQIGPTIRQKNKLLEKAILETDEKVGIILMLREGKWIQPLPDDGSIAAPSIIRLKAEVLYNRLPFIKGLFMFNLCIGLLSLMIWVKSEIYGREGTFSYIWKAALYLSLGFQLFSYGLRGYISGHLPLSNGYETMQFLALAVLFTAGWLHRRFAVLLPLGFLLSGFTLLVAHLGQMNPQITPLMPVLQSPWLSLHVSLIMMAYALLGFTFLLAILTLFLLRRLSQETARHLTILSRLLLYPAILFLGIGIFIGAIWANETWGRYWAWDPKEVWALITFMTYGLGMHSTSISFLRTPKFYHIYMLIAFATVLMTYFGVNYLLGGMHSYAG